MADTELTSVDQSELTGFLERAGYRLRSLKTLAGDVSPRRYARLDLGSGATAIVALYPADPGAGCRRFERTTALLERVGVRAPRILASDCEHGLMLLEDLGPETLFDRTSLGADERLEWFERAIEAARRIATLDPGEIADLNPRLDGPLLLKELRQTIDLYLLPHDLLGTDGASRKRSTRALEALCMELGAAEPVPCHRDFMARNLVPHADGIAVLDHQDLRLGPPAYDLASLLNDSFFPPVEVETHLLAAAGVSAESRTRYHRAALQRTLKAIGTFTAFARPGPKRSERHLPLIAPTLERALQHLPLTPETREISADLAPLWGRHLEAIRPGRL